MKSVNVTDIPTCEERHVPGGETQACGLLELKSCSQTSCSQSSTGTGESEVVDDALSEVVDDASQGH